MTQEFQNRIKIYISKELYQIGKPRNPSKEQVHIFKDLDGSLDLLFQLLDVKIDEPTIQRVGPNFYTHVLKILDFDEPELPNAIEGLATNFEAFLKKLAFTKYQNSPLWYGDGNHSEGLVKTTLANLYNGVINNKYSTPPEIPLKALPEPLMENKGIQRNILDFIRSELRNAVHNARIYSRMELLHYSNIVLSGYLFAIEDNLTHLKKHFLNEYLYLEKIVQETEYESLDKVYVDLFGLETLKDIEVLGSEIIDSHFLQSDLEQYYSAEEDSDLLINEKRVDSIMNIASDTRQFQLIGKPGSGKSTTLLKILYKNAELILNGESSLKIPFYINANEYRPNNNFIEILSKKLNTEWVLEHLKKGRIQLLIDGLNEIAEKFKSEAYQDISTILKDYPDISIILSERKYNFERRFDLPVYELKDLNDEQIKSFIHKYSSRYAIEIWKQLQSNEYMMQLAYNPLMLKMILWVSRKGVIPLNRGLLLKTFLNSIFHREKSKFSQISIDTKIDVLAYVAFTLRLGGNVSVPVSKFKNLISTHLRSKNSNVDLNHIYNELLDNLVLKESQNEEVSFFHETYQEYFCAVQIKQNFEVSDTLDIDIYDDTWFEVLLICGELFKNEQIVKCYFENIFVGPSKQVAKRLEDFTMDDTNSNIDVACKISYALKEVRPKIYSLAETYLLNYLTLWKYIWHSKKIQILSPVTLFKAVASLNSERVILYITNNLGWVNLWLGNELLTEDVTNQRFLRHPSVFEAISTNTPNFTFFYNILKITIPTFEFSRTISNNLKVLKYEILRSQSENQLINYFERHKDFDVFLEIVRNNIEYVSHYKFENNLEHSNEHVLRTIIKSHIRSEYARDIILRELLRTKYDRKLFATFIRTLHYFEEKQSLLAVMSILLERNIDIFQSNIQFLQTIPYKELTLNLKNYFKTNLNLLQIPIEGISLQTLLIGKVYKDLIFVDEIYTINEKRNIQIKSIAPLHSQGKRTVTLEYKMTKLGNIPSEGILTLCNKNQTTTLNYTKLKISKKASNIVTYFLLQDFDHSFAELSQFEIKVNDVSDWMFRHSQYEALEDENLVRVVFENCDENSNDSSILEKEETLYLLPYQVLHTTKPFLYHPELIKTNKTILDQLASTVNSAATVSFIDILGLRHLFINHLKNHEYGIVVRVYNKVVIVFSITNQIVKKIICYNQIEYPVNHIVLIESNETICLLTKTEANSDDIGYLESDIIHLDKKKEEGFIKLTGLRTMKDYFFSFTNCDFIPELGDRVRFIPALNPSKGNYNKPIAVRISKVENGLP